MAFRCWVGLWLFGICVMTALLELSFVLKYFTRFTEEIFAMLVSLIFCVSVVESLIKVISGHSVFEVLINISQSLVQLTSVRFLTTRSSRLKNLQDGRNICHNSRKP